MNEICKMGFTHEVIAFSPDGKETKHFVVHNIVPDEGLKNFLRLIFIDSHWNIAYNLCLMTNYYEPHAADTYKTMWAYNSQYALFDDGEKYQLQKGVTFIKNNDNNAVNSSDSSDLTFTFSAPKLVTGTAICSFSGDGFNIGGYNAAIVSAALFPSPIQMEKNGKLTIKAGFTFISA